MTHDEITSIDRARMVTFGFGDWQLILTEDRQLAGECVWRDRTVKLSAWLLSRADAAQITDTILHEIAHALVGPVTVARGETVRIEVHGQEWKACARRIGANPDATVHGLRRAEAVQAQIDAALDAAEAVADVRGGPLLIGEHVWQKGTRMKGYVIKLMAVNAHFYIPGEDSVYRAPIAKLVRENTYA